MGHKHWLMTASPVFWFKKKLKALLFRAVFD